jgi:hypothetical protein
MPFGVFAIRESVAVAWLAARSRAHCGLAMSQAPVLVPEVARGRALKLGRLKAKSAWSWLAPGPGALNLTVNALLSTDAPPELGSSPSFLVLRQDASLTKGIAA